MELIDIFSRYSINLFDTNSGLFFDSVVLKKALISSEFIPKLSFKDFKIKFINPI